MSQKTVINPPIGPGAPYQVLFSEAAARSEPSESLPGVLRAVLGADWAVPRFEQRPYVYSNLAASRDGRMSFALPGFDKSGVVTAANPHDRWLMALLRARADAVLMGDTTVKIETGILATAEHVCDYDAAAWAALRALEGRAPEPLMVILSYDCALEPSEACFQRMGAHVVLATTRHGIERAKALRARARIDAHLLGEEAVDLPALVRLLHEQYGVRSLLCEGGPRVMAGMFAAKLIDEEFLTYCPVIVGASCEQPRPSYVEGVAFAPHNAPQSSIQALRRAGDFLFLHTRVDYRDA